MRYHLTVIRYILLVFSFFVVLQSRATDKDSLALANKKPVSSLQGRIDKSVTIESSKRFGDLDKYLEQQVFSVKDGGTGFDNAFYDGFNNPPDTSLATSRAMADRATKEMDLSNHYVDYLQPSDIYKLPVGFKKKIGNGSEITIAVSSAIFKPTYAELTVFARLTIPQFNNGKPIFFGIKGLKLSYGGGIIGNARLVLFGDVAIPINGNSTALILKGGGFNTNTGTTVSDDKTYITLDCKGFKEIGLTADLQFSRNMIVPVSPTTGAPLPMGNVTANFTNLKVSNWNDIIATVSFDKPFQIKGINGFVFTVQTAAFDFSDLRNNPDIVYPIGYQDKYLQASNLNTWRGVYVKQLSLALPKSFKNRDYADTNTRVTLGVNDLIIDNNGLTGVFFANNILPLKSGNAAGWKFSVDSLRIAVEASQLRRAGFGGRLGLPVNKTSEADTLSKSKFLGYSASINFSGDYVCKVITQDTLDFNVFIGRVVLLPNSYVQLTGNSDHFEAEAMLNGKIGIVSNIMNRGDNGGGRSSIADMKGIEFQELHITSYAPYFAAKFFGYNGELKFGNFPISFERISLVKPTATTVGISFNVKLNLGDEKGESSSFSGKAGLTVIGEISSESGGILNWQFQKIKVDSVIIKATIKEAFKLDGWVKFFDDTNPSSSRYGRGFEGGLKLEFLKGLKVKVDMRALFAKAPTFRYWYVDGKVDFGTGIGAAPLRVRGLAGGAFYGMKKNGFDDPFSGTGINYSADSTAGLGLKASLLFDGGTKVLSGEASFEIAFNRGGGLRYIGFFGMVRLSEDILPGGLSADGFLGKQLKKLTSYEQNLSTVDLAKFKDLKETNPTAAAEKQKKESETNAAQGDKDPADNTPGAKGISAYLGIQYDFNASTLHASFDMYINAAGGLITGVGNNNRAGWAVFHTQPGKWYLHVGTPTAPIGIKFGIGSFYIKTTAYFMIGHDMPAFPPLPPQVISILAQSGLNYQSNMSSSTVAGGRGIAFGAAVAVQTGDLRFLIFYANFSAGLGFDVMLKDFGPTAHCAGSNETIGINGWYAMGQAYAYFQGELGVNIKLFFIKKKIVIIRGGAAAVLQAKMPRPTWVGGALGVYISILNGLIKGHFNFKFSFGNDCQIVYDAPPSEEDIKVIEEIKPEVNATGVNVLERPTVKFRLKPGSVLEVSREDGSGNDYYKPNLDYIKLYKGDTLVPISITYNTAGDLATILPSAILKGTRAYKLSVKVSFQRYHHGTWVTYTVNGQPVEELKEINFTTGPAPVELPISLISRLYPFNDQRNYYKDEPNKGITKLAQEFPDFFANFNRWKIKVETLTGALVSTIYATTAQDKYFYYNMPTNLQTNTTYKFTLEGEGATNPSLDTSKPALTFKFTTSNYPTLASKINALQMVQPIVGRVASDVIDLQASVANYEGFELYELVGNQYTENIPMIEAEADVTDEPYFNQVLKPLFYTGLPTDTRLYDTSKNYHYTLTPGLDQYGIPAFKAITPSWYYVNSLSNGTFNSLLRTRMAYVHNTNKYMNLQFLDYRNQIINRYLNNNYSFESASANIKNIVNRGFPFMLIGNYKAKFTFVQLDNPRTRGTIGEFIYQNPIE